MNSYVFDVQICQRVAVVASSAEEARMKIINRQVETIINCSCDELNLDPYVSDGFGPKKVEGIQP